MSTQAVERDTSLRSVVKSFDLIEALIEQGEATAAELAVLVGEPRSSVYRMLTTLQQIEIVESGSRRGLFRPGLGLVRLCGAVLTRFDERQLVMPVLDRLRAETKETVHLDICGKCHPFFTGEQRIVDTAGRVERFRLRYENAARK